MLLGHIPSAPRPPLLLQPSSWLPDRFRQDEAAPQWRQQPPQRPIFPLVGASLDPPLPARDLSQRKSLAVEAGGRGHFSLLARPFPTSLAGHTVYYSKGGIWSAGLEMGGHDN